MADPQSELAPIIGPRPPADAAAAAAAPLGIGAAVAVLLLAIALVAWRRWRRRVPLRRLRALPQQADPIAAAHELAALLRRHGIAPGSEWTAQLDRLRFGRPAADARTTLARLCADAEAALRGRLAGRP